MINRLQLYGDWLMTNPMGFVVYMLYFVVVVLFSLILHECAHGWVALQCGDPTAKMLGRLSLDPRKHLDPIGTICMFLLGFGWAKPVPVIPRNFRDPKRDDFLVSVAGITVNLTLFILCTALSVGINRLMVGPDIYAANSGSITEKTDLYNGFGNLIAYGYSASLHSSLASQMAMPWLQYVQRFLIMMRHVNLSLAVFNLLPIPPLDGYRLVNNLFKGRFTVSEQASQMTRMALLVLCVSGLLSQVLSAVTGALDDAVVNLFMLF